jgi:branched-chain amino acid transport system substrate-binding protein
VLQAWAKSVNAGGGINGRPVKLIVMDDKGDPATALADAQELVQQDKVVAIIGASSGADASWAGYVQQQKVAVITGLPGSADYSTNPSLFLIGTDLQASTWVGVHEAKALGGTKMDLVVCSEVPECKDVAAVTKPLATQQGVKLTLVQAVSATQPDYTAECLAAKQAGATVIDMVTVQATWARFAESCASQNFPSLLDPPWKLRSLTHQGGRARRGGQYSGCLPGIRK